MTTEFGKRLRKARDHAGLTQEQLSSRVGMAQSTYAAAESSGDGSRMTAQIAHECGVNAFWLATGHGDMFDSPNYPAHAALEPLTARERWHPAYLADAVAIPLLANAASMGQGSDLLHDDVVVGNLMVSQQWVQRHLRPTSGAALRFIHAYGDSMAPTFTDGDVLLVDTGARDPAGIDGVYVLQAHDRLFVKRVRKRLDGQLEVSSDNPSVKTVDELNGDVPLPVIGRVIWVWKGLRL